VPDGEVRPQRVCALLLFAVATLARGSGFLAVFAAGIVLGATLAFVIRPVVVGLCLRRSGWAAGSGPSCCSRA
jgi:NhaP-type Na+/H+ and K+/H+ antiporter